MFVSSLTFSDRLILASAADTDVLLQTSFTDPLRHRDDFDKTLNARSHPPNCCGRSQPDEVLRHDIRLADSPQRPPLRLYNNVAVQVWHPSSTSSPTAIANHQPTSPVSAYWTLSFVRQKCINEEAHVLAAGVINTVMDFIIVLLPIKTVKNLQLPTRQRIVVYLLFTGGLLASVAGGIRTYFTWRLTSAPDHDITWNSYYVMLLSSIELFVGIVCHLPAPACFLISSWELIHDPLTRYAPPSQLQSPSSGGTYPVS